MAKKKAYVAFVRGVMMSVRITRFNCLGLSSSDTHKLTAFEKLYRSAMNRNITRNNFKPFVLDPFARTCLWGTRRNDINPQFLKNYTTHCMDAIDFMKMNANETTDIILFDPPFSDRQSKEEYGTNNLYANPKYISVIGNEIFRVLKPNGYVIKCGYNSNPPCKGLELVAMHICYFGASINDILITMWIKKQTSLGDVE